MKIKPCEEGSSVSSMDRRVIGAPERVTTACGAMFGK